MKPLNWSENLFHTPGIFPKPTLLNRDSNKGRKEIKINLNFQSVQVQLIGKVNPYQLYTTESKKVRQYLFIFLQNIAKNILPKKVSYNQPKDVDIVFKVFYFFKKNLAIWAKV